MKSYLVVVFSAVLSILGLSFFLDEVSADNQEFILESESDATSISSDILYLKPKQTVLNFLESQGVSHSLAKTIWKNPKSKQTLLSGITTENPIICDKSNGVWHYCHILIAPKRVIRIAKHGDEILITDQYSEPQKSIDYGRIHIKSSIFRDGEIYDKMLLNELNLALVGFLKRGNAVQPDDFVEFLYERKHYDQGFEVVGHVVDMVYKGKKQNIHLSRYKTKGNNFFDDNGTSATKGFLKYPVKNAYISSPFSKGRKHPVYGVTKPHHGVDLAAKKNSKIVATAPGKVIFVGPKGGYGNSVMLQHKNSYITLYAHMNKFPKGLKVGQNVKAGDLIGYVGSTGISTGPHVHYEIRHHNIPIDPMKSQVKRLSQLSGKDLKDHKQNQANWDMLRLSFS